MSTFKAKGDRTAQTHSNQHALRQKGGGGGAAQKKDGEAGVPADRRVVFRPVLDSPLAVKWPTLPAFAQTAILHALVSLLNSLQASTSLASGPGIRRRHGKRASDGRLKGDAERSKRPFFVAGINAVSRALEDQIARARRDAAPHSTGEGAKGATSPDVSQGVLPTQPSRESRPAKAPTTAPPPIATTQLSPAQVESAAAPCPLRIVFACRHDIDPPALIAHLPIMACAVNGLAEAKGTQARTGVKNSTAAESAASPIFLVPLPKGAELVLADVLGIRRVAVLGLLSDVPAELLDPLLSLLSQHLQPPTSPWLVPSSMLPLPNSPTSATRRNRSRKESRSTQIGAQAKATGPRGPLLMSPRVKHLKATAPVDMKAAAAAKKKLRQDAKARWKKERARIKKDETQNRTRKKSGASGGGAKIVSRAGEEERLAEASLT